MKARGIIITVQYLSVSVRMQFRMIDYAMGAL